MKSLIPLFTVCLLLWSCESNTLPKVYKPVNNTQTETKPGFKTYYDQFEVEGSFILFDQKENKYFYYNEDQLNQAFLPASTFKICNTLIGLETGVIPDEHFTLKWDKVDRKREALNKDHDLNSAFKNSVLWYYQEVARRIGGNQMKSWLNKIDYGNKDTTGGIDKFWIEGGLRITPKQQVDFLVRMNTNKLPVSKRSIGILKQVMLASDTNNVKLYAKSGWGTQQKTDIGWYVGFIERDSKVYYFATCIQSKDLEKADFGEARIAITNSILKEMKLID